MRGALAALVLGLAAVPASAAEPASDRAKAVRVRIGAIAARLWYSLSGKLSDDLLARKEPFVGWNTIIGEGPVEEPASDLLVEVVMFGNGSDAQSIEDPLEIWVTDKSGKSLARRRVDYMLLPYQGGLHNVLWLPDVGCAGRLTIHARFRKQVKTASLALDCGE